MIDELAFKRHLSIPETEARDLARVLISLEEVYDKRMGELLFGAIPLDEKVEIEIRRMGSEIHELVLIVEDLKHRQDEQTERMELIARVQIVPPRRGNGRDEAGEEGRPSL